VLQHALHRSFQRGRESGSGEIGYDHYRQAGTLQAALNDHAEQILNDLTAESPEGYVLVQRLFRCLTTVVNGRRVRRPARLDRIQAVTGATDDASQKLITAAIRSYADPSNSLLVLSPAGELRPETVVDISHESLIERWRRLREWVDQEAECVRWYADAAEDTLRFQRGQSQTWRDPKLAYVRRFLDDGTWNEAWAEWSLENSRASFEEVRAFLDRSSADQANEKEEEAREQRERLEKAEALADAEREAAQSASARADAERRGKRRLAALLLLAIAMGVFAAYYYRRANRMEKDLAEALLAQTEALNRLNTLTLRIQNYDSQIRDTEARLKTQKLRPGEAGQLKGLIAALQEERANLQSGLVVAESNLREARDSMERITGLMGPQSQYTEVSPPNPEPPKIIEKSDGLRYISVPAGTFRMGCSPADAGCDPDESPLHEVQLSSYYIGESEVTQAAWAKVMKTNPSQFRGDSLPVEMVTWDDADRYCRAIGGRLPTEAEWEYAARAGTTAASYGALQEIAWYNQNSNAAPHPVRQRQANAWGLYDTLGNVWEWVADWHGRYPAGKQKDPQGPAGGLYRMLRGGSWFNYPGFVRVSIRYRVEPSFRNIDVGLRCAL
jgi:formylglycine-generating enzyme required for sulfatase activity